MQNDFIRTQLTLINRLAKDTKSAHEEDWARFFDLYYPAMVKFAELHGGGEASEDIAQDAIVKIVNAFRAGKYSRRPGISFRAYLMTILRNELSLAYWREQARGAGRKVEVDEASASEPEAAGAWLDVEWRIARHRAAVEHVLGRVVIAERSKQVYRAVVIEGRSIAEVAAEFRLSRNEVSQIKLRMDRRIAAVESMYEE